MRLDRYFLGCLLLLTLVLRSSANEPTACYRFTLQELESSYQWSVDACDAEAAEIRSKDGVEFIIIDESILEPQPTTLSTTAAMIFNDHPENVQCWRFTLQELESSYQWSVEACDGDADYIRSRHGLDYIICEEIAM